jgi:hypothetical protein
MDIGEILFIPDGGKSGSSGAANTKFEIEVLDQRMPDIISRKQSGVSKESHSTGTARG